MCIRDSIHRAPLGTHERFIGFLIEHFAGNFPLWLAPVQMAIIPISNKFNDYAQFMSTNPIVKILSIVTYISIIAHVLVTLALTIDSKLKRPSRYRYAASQTNSISSKYMGVLGTVILAFIIVHLSNFWYKAKFEGETDIYNLVISKFQHLDQVTIYVISMLAIFFHVLHGFASSFQSLGLVTSKTRKYFKIFSESEVGKKILKDRIQLVSILKNKEFLSRLPKNTLGYKYYEFIYKEDLSPEELIVAVPLRIADSLENSIFICPGIGESSTLPDFITTVCNLGNFFLIEIPLLLFQYRLVYLI